jgi:quercetin dioxygenase-like cupin family protein
MDTQEFEAGLRAEQYGEIVIVEKPVGYSMGEHQHPFDACALITAGAITITVDGVERNFAVGDVFRLKAGTPHLENAASHGVTYVVGRRQVAVPSST